MSNEKVDRFRALAEKDPANPLHRFALAQACLAAGDYAAAEAAFARCLQLKPDWMVAAIKRGRCLIDLKRWEEARASLELAGDLAQKQGHDEPWAEIRELMAQLP
jgi:tetratricopeptide (TPR) repeat protein